MEKNSREKLVRKHIDMIAANSLNVPGAGFGTDTNVITLLTSDGSRQLAQMSKQAAANEILNEIKMRISPSCTPS